MDDDEVERGRWCRWVVGCCRDPRAVSQVVDEEDDVAEVSGSAEIWMMTVEDRR